MPNTRLKAMERRGVARENVVAVPARRANTAVRSMSLPQTPSTPLSKKRPACLGVLLFVPLAHMEHKAKGHSQNDVKAPWDGTPVEQRDRWMPSPAWLPCP